MMLAEDLRCWALHGSLRCCRRGHELTASSNSAYVVFLSAAQALVAGAVPTGVVLFAAIAPALLAKLCWPFVRAHSMRNSAKHGLP